MTIGQMRLFVREAVQLEREQRAAFVQDVYAAAAGVMAEDGHQAVQQRVAALCKPLGG